MDDVCPYSIINEVNIPLYPETKSRKKMDIFVLQVKFGP